MKKTILIAAVMFFAFSVAASAQALFQVGSTPVTAAASCGATELTGDVVFTQVDGSPAIQTGRITLSYGVPIVRTDQISVTAISSNGTPIPGLATIDPASGFTSGQVSLIITGPPTIGAPPYTIRVSGVRVNLAQNPSLTSLSTTVSSTVNSFVGGQTSVVVISSIASAIGSIDANPNFLNLGPSSALINVNAVSPGFGTDGKIVQVDVNEGFANAFVQNSIVGLTFSAIPAGVTLSLPGTVTTVETGQTFQIVDTDTLTPLSLSLNKLSLSSTSTSLTVFYKLVSTTATGPTLQETLRIPITVNTAFGATFPLPTGTVTVTADMFPKYNPFSFSPAVIPSYFGTSCQKGPLTILSIITGNTTLLIPYAVSSAGYDTGIAIANTSKDPLSAAQTAIPQNAPITFTFFPQATATEVPASFTYTTSATTPGQGLIAGSLNSGSLYTVLLSQLLTAAGKPGNFSGYIFAIVNATNCHGQYFISDFEAFTNGALMLVVDPAGRNSLPEKLDN